MLISLTIKNYALIDHLKVSLSDGLTVITGETGAGKSILLGGLSLILGKRADLTSLRNKKKKCIIEAVFDLSKYELQSFFADNDLEYEAQTIIRREIHPSAKSRAFINDSPVTLDKLSNLGDRLIDIHSQHQTLQLTDSDFQLKVIDALADNSSKLLTYKNCLHDFRLTENALAELLELQKTFLKEHDYNTFLLNELEEATLEAGMQESLEEEHEQLVNVETIIEELSHFQNILIQEQQGLVDLIVTLKQISYKLSSYGKQFSSLHERIQSVGIEIDDIATEVDALHDTIEVNPNRLEEINERLKRIYDLQKKHGVGTIQELLIIQEQLSEKVAASQDIESNIQAKEALLKEKTKDLELSAKVLSERRKEAIPNLKQHLETNLVSLGIPNASFKISLYPVASFKNSGKDELIFLFTANKGTSHGELKKVASGGELSRIMLTIKAILAHYEQLPTLMFDEIDSGVSGGIAQKMGDIMLEMSKKMQIFTITHLPQIASKGDQHFKVYKEDKNSETITKMKVLKPDERVVELAEMLGGKALTDSAIAHARQLLN